MVNRRANVPEQEWWDFPHHLSTCNASGRDSPNVRTGFNTERGRRGNEDLIMVSVREIASCSDENPDGQWRLSVSVRKHQESEMVSKRLC